VSPISFAYSGDMLVAVPVLRVARCQAPRKAASSTRETSAARRRRVMAGDLSTRRPGEGRDPYAALAQSGTRGAVALDHWRPWLWVPAFAGTTAGCPSRRLPDLEARQIIIRLGRIEGLAHYRKRFVAGRRWRQPHLGHHLPGVSGEIDLLGDGLVIDVALDLA